MINLFSDGQEELIINKTDVDKFLSLLKLKDRETIWLWASGNTLKEISEYISIKYEGRTQENLLSARAMGARIGKIIERLQK